MAHNVRYSRTSLPGSYLPLALELGILLAIGPTSPAALVKEGLTAAYCRASKTVEISISQ